MSPLTFRIPKTKTADQSPSIQGAVHICPRTPMSPYSLALLKGLPLDGAIAGDAAFCQRAICRTVRDGDGDCLFAGKAIREIVYAIISLPRERADPEDLLSRVRQYWSIENRLRWRRDVALREVASRIRSGTAPHALAALRNTMLRLVNAIPGPLAAIRETFAENRLDAIARAKQDFL